MNSAAGIAMTMPKVSKYLGKVKINKVKIRFWFLFNEKDEKAKKSKSSAKLRG